MSKTSPLAPLQSGEGKNRNAEINTIFFQRGEVTAKNEPLFLEFRSGERNAGFNSVSIPKGNELFSHFIFNFTNDNK